MSRISEMTIKPFSIYLFLLVSSVALAIAYPIATFAMYLYYACVVVGLLCLLLSKQELFLNRNKAMVIISCVLIMVYYFILYSYSDKSIGTSKGRFIAIEIITVNMIILALYKNSNINENRLQKYFYIFSLAAIMSTFIAFDHQVLLMSISRLVRFNSSIINGNMYAMGMDIIALFVIHRIVTEKRWRIIKCIVLLAVLFLLSLPSSRTALLTLFVGVILYFYIASPNNKKVVRILQICLTLLVVLYLMSLFESTSAILDRIATIWERNDAIVAASDQSRWGLIRLGFDGWREKPLFGQGFNSFGQKSSIVIGFSTYAHNNFIEILYDNGLVGLILLYMPKIVLIITLYKRIKSAKPNRFDCFMLSSMIVLLMFDFAVVSYYYLNLNYIWIFAIPYVLNNKN